MLFSRKLWFFLTNFTPVAKNLKFVLFRDFRHHVDLEIHFYAQNTPRMQKNRRLVIDWIDY